MCSSSPTAVPVLLQPLSSQVWRLFCTSQNVSVKVQRGARMNKDQIWMNKNQICRSLRLHHPSPPFLSLSSWAIRKASVSVFTSWPPPLQPLLSRTWKKGFAKLLGIKRWRGSEKQSNTLCILIYICFRARLTGACSTCFCHASNAKNKGMGLIEFFCVLPRIRFVFPCLTFNSPKTWV